jgi:hypothetical protein
VAFNAGWVYRSRAPILLFAWIPTICCIRITVRRLAARLESESKCRSSTLRGPEIDARGLWACPGVWREEADSRKPRKLFELPSQATGLLTNICMFRKAALDSLPYVFKELNFCEEFGISP